MSFLKKIPSGNVSALQYFRLMRYGTMILIGVVFTNAPNSFSLSEIGTYEAFMLIAGAASFFWVNGLIQSLLPLYNSSKAFGKIKPETKSPVFFNIFILILLLGFLSIIFLFIFKENISGEADNKFFGFLALYVFLVNPSHLVENIYLLKNKPRHIILYGLISFFIQFVVVASPAVLGYGVYESFAGLIFVTAIRFIWLVFLLYKYSSFIISIPFIKEYLHLGFPLVLSTLLSGSAQYFDAFLVKETYGKNYLAVFQYGARELPLALIMASAFSNAMLPVFSQGKSLFETLNLIRKKSLFLMHFLFPLTILLIAISNIVYPIIYNSEFTESAKIFNIYLLLVISRMVFPQTILIGLKKTKTILWASLYEILINVSLSIIFIYYFGMIGVAYATIIAYFFEKAFLIQILKREKIYPGTYIPIKPVFLYSTLTIIVYLVFDYMIFTDFI
ncbi:MAG: oligosaccharide flippase family protein [Bacteroidales bacterium]|nr:oligosaccharide flippase family protein [Bacteroidales bacterium]